jgi:demethylmenaquinone methyltransferase/2-methoxy-6-polyprenyl-1,4-benzoquinol methylase
MPAAEGREVSHFGSVNVPLADKQGLVDAVFHRVARRYDLMNDLMSGGLHRAWKAAMVRRLDLPRGPAHTALLDVAGGTGDIAFRALEAGSHGLGVTVLDINGEMLEVGRERAAERGLSGRVAFVQGNAEALPFPDRSVDAVTIAFGIRNVPRIAVALGEMRRVLRIGGKFLCLEFSRVEMPVLEQAYELYSDAVIPRLGRWVAGDEDSYRYLVESIRRFPDSETFAGMLRAAGFERVTATPFSGGIAVLHSGWRL